MTDADFLKDIILKVAPGLIPVAQWIYNYLKWRGIPKDVRDVAFAFNNFSWTKLQQSDPFINSIGVIKRPEIETIKNFWNSENIPIILHGEAGSGKTGIVIRLGKDFTNQGIPVLFIEATDFPKYQDPTLIIQQRMPLDIPLLEAIKKISSKKPCIVILDQLDSVAGTDLCKMLVSFLNSLIAFPNVKVLAVSRTYEVEQDPDISTLNFHHVECGNLNPTQAASYLSELGISNPSKTILELSCNLLNLSLIADIRQRSPDQEFTIVNEVNLWQQYFYYIQKFEGEEISDFVLELARTVSSKGERIFNVKFSKPEIRRKLISRKILILAPGRRFAFRHEQLQDFLCAYSLLPEQPGLNQLLNEFGRNLSRGVIGWLQWLYHLELPENEASLVDEVLNARDVLPFYSRIPVLENLKRQFDPSEASARVISRYSSEWAYQLFFFKDLDKPTWIPPLFAAGIFFKPPDPIEVQPGSFQLPGWPAGEYLARFADQHEDIVVSVVQSIQTENWGVQEILLDALLKISPATAAGLVSAINGWLNGRFSDMLPNRLNELADNLLENGFIDSAILIFEYVTTPILPKSKRESSSYLPSIRFRSDRYWVNEYCEKQLSKLIQRDPAGVVRVFERQLIKTIELTKQEYPEDAEKRIGYFWTLNFSSHSTEKGNAEPLEIFINGLRESLLEVCMHEDDGRKYLLGFLNSEHLIFKRVAILTLRAVGQKYHDLVDQALLQRLTLEEVGLTGVYNGLLRDQFGSASKEVRAQVIDWILSGPNEIESRAKRIANYYQREVTDEDRKEAREYWTLEHLEMIKNLLSGEALKRLNELVAIYGQPDITERPPYVITEWGNPSSPIPAEELAQKDFTDLKRLLVDFIPENSLKNSREGLAQAIQGLVRDNPERYGAFALHLIDPLVQYLYIHHFLSGIREGIKNKTARLSNEILELCEYIVSVKDDLFEKSSGEHEPGLLTAQTEVLRLLDVALRTDDPYLTRDQLNCIRALLLALAHHPDPETGADEKNEFDPFTHSMNCVRGEAMHGIIQYSLYLIRQQEKQVGQRIKAGQLEPEIKELLDEKLDRSLEPSLAIHCIYGAYLPQLQFLSRNWLINNLHRIFPEDESQKPYWLAAWNAYVIGANVYSDVFKILIPQYRRGLQLFNQPQPESKFLGGSPDERLAQHLMFAYLADLTDFGHENELLDLFYKYAPDNIRAQGVFWLSQVLENENPSSDDVLWKKCWSLWQKRLAFAETEEVEKNTHEISNYLRWLSHCPLGFDVLYPILQKSVKYFSDGFNARQLCEYAAEHCDRNPLEAVTLLQMSILGNKETWRMTDEKDEERILRAAMVSGNNEAKQIAIEIINYWGERGNFRWKALLG